MDEEKYVKNYSLMRQTDVLLLILLLLLSPILIIAQHYCKFIICYEHHMNRDSTKGHTTVHTNSILVLAGLMPY